MAAYWLMKSEPDTFGIDDLKRVGVEPWTGVRNYQARNFMRDGMKVGDLALFYHSNATPPGVAGIAKIVRTGVVDQTQFEPSSPYYDPASKRGDPRWICVDVEFVEKLARLVPLEELRADPRLEGMVLLQRSRLSVQPVESDHWKRILTLARAAPPDKPAMTSPRQRAAKSGARRERR